ncbi:hypothetical protein N7492_009990 [Penicillium capsulatum]|uniref:Uncharacterized protein n=1 Tax=Penicillium capsulatum TaxID=69766 RepID=A0A9W9HMW9_9EURO|nr:hypothetical protein N7492_009990 [Penicillium capsulatum]KAJ6112499.1 hypothetical protein N7512_007823 [Penicillium capsulatum]
MIREATTQSPVVRLVPATDMPTPVSIAPNDNVACPGRGLDKVSNLSQPSSQSPRAEGQRTTCERTPTVTLESNDVSIPTIAHDQRAISVEEAAVSNVTTRETTMPLPEALTQSNESQPAFKEMPREIIDLEALNQSETTAASRTDYPPASSVAYNRPTPAATSSEPDKELFKLLAPVVQDLRVMVKYLSEAVPNEIILKFHRDYQARAKRLIALVIDSRGKLRSYRFVSARTPRIVNMTEQMRGCAWDISHEIAKICRADRVGADAAAQRDAALSRLQSLDRKYSWNIEMCAMLLENQPA